MVHITSITIQILKIASILNSLNIINLILYTKCVYISFFDETSILIDNNNCLLGLSSIPDSTPCSRPQNLLSCWGKGHEHIGLINHLSIPFQKKFLGTGLIILFYFAIRSLFVLGRRMHYNFDLNLMG
jgi:hypothetical protein